MNVSHVTEVFGEVHCTKLVKLYSSMKSLGTEPD